MHKLKNKHTGEVITTPYMAEVEEYLNSGDYEMSDNKYPAILKLGNGCIVLADSDRCGTSLSYYKDDYEETFENKYYRDFNSFDFSKNITREYLTNTYGKCESQEHADFICKLAENAGFNATNDYSALRGRVWFVITSYRIEFLSLPNDTKLIHLPLPPKKKPMEETKPTYTKEMHERGELPPVGSECLCFDFEVDGWFTVKVLDAETKSNELAVASISDNNKGSFVKLWWGCKFKPIPKIEDELIEFFENTFSSFAYSIGGNKFLVKELTDEYNITPKES